tara:strand:+ start:135 stop:251 length:117 start_codon:yes stop_codon:yes gene_type:complete
MKKDHHPFENQIFDAFREREKKNKKSYNIFKKEWLFSL